MNVGEKIKYFSERFYGNQQRFADRIGMKRSALNRYVKGKYFPNFIALKKFKDAGMSIDWLIDGYGTILAKNDSGFKLKNGLKIEEPLELKESPKRMIQWINENYICLELFVLTTDIEFEELYNLIYEEKKPNRDFLKKIEAAGCNFNWVINGKGAKFSDNIVGKFLELKLTSRVEKTRSQDEKMKSRIFTDIEQEKFLDFIRDLMNNDE